MQYWDQSQVDFSQNKQVPTELLVASLTLTLWIPEQTVFTSDKYPSSPIILL